jgi:hypothetical protein
MDAAYGNTNLYKLWSYGHHEQLMTTYLAVDNNVYFDSQDLKGL